MNSNPRVLRRFWRRFTGSLVLSCIVLIGRATAFAFEPAVPTNSPAWQGSAALFVGVAQFDGDSGLAGLRYTAEDAIALAALATQELRLVPAGHVWLALSGQPVSAETKTALVALEKAGVHRVPADRKSLMQAARAAADAASDQNGLLLMSFSTHGFDSGGQLYLMPSDGQVSDIEGTGVPWRSVKKAVVEATASKRLLLIDACRQPVVASSRGDESMNVALAKALQDSKGFGLLAACSQGQKSWEDEKFGHGVFTHFLLDALRGKAPANPRDGFIHLGDVVNYSTAQTKDFIWHAKSVEQDPSFNGDPSALDIPLAMDPSQQEKIKLLHSQGDLSLNAISEARRTYPGVLDNDQIATLLRLLNETSGAELEHLVAKCQEVAAHKTDRAALEDFAAWFKGKYGSLPQSPVPTPQPASLSDARGQASPVPASSPKPILLIFFENASPTALRFWRAPLPAQFRGFLAKTLRDGDAFNVSALELNINNRASLTRQNNQPGIDYVLKIRVDQFDHKLTTSQKGINTPLVNLNFGETSADPKTAVSLAWSLLRVSDGVELKSDSIAAAASGPPLNVPNQKNPNLALLERQATWADPLVLSNLANDLAAAVKQVKLK